MKWVFISAAVIIGVPLLLTVVGLLLPRGHVASRSLRLRHGPEPVWETITAVASWPSWRSDVTKVERLPDQNGHPVWAEVSKNGRLPLEVTEMSSPGRFVTRIADPKLPFGGSWTYEISPTTDGCIIRITENGEVYNPLFRVMSKLFMDPAATLETYLGNLARKFGEEPVIEL